MTVSEMTYGGLEALAIAVVKSASEEYIKELKTLKRLRSRVANAEDESHRRKLKAELVSQEGKVRNVERFFITSPFVHILNADGRYLMERLRKEVA